MTLGVTAFGGELVEVFIPDERGTFFNLQERCEAEEGNLVRIQSFNENRVAINVMRLDDTPNDELYWVGLKREEDSNLEPTNPLSFDFIDGKGGDKSFFTDREVKPWIDGEPSALPGGETCVLAFDDGSANAAWRASECSIETKGVCSRDFSLEEDSLELSSCFRNNFDQTMNEFFMINIISDLLDGDEVCQEFRGNIAIIQNPSEHRLAKKFMNRIAGGDDVLIGVKRFTLENGVASPANFSFFQDLQGSNEFFEKLPGEFPWRDFPEPLTVKCVVATEDDRLWKPVGCGATVRRSLCRRACTASSVIEDNTISSILLVAASGFGLAFGVLSLLLNNAKQKKVLVETKISHVGETLNIINGNMDKVL